MNNLFTLEAFRLLRNRLADDGLVAQWIQFYEMDLPTYTWGGRYVGPDGEETVFERGQDRRFDF